METKRKNNFESQKYDFALETATRCAKVVSYVVSNDSDGRQAALLARYRHFASICTIGSIGVPMGLDGILPTSNYVWELIMYMLQEDSNDISWRLGHLHYYAGNDWIECLIEVLANSLVRLKEEGREEMEGCVQFMLARLCIDTNLIETAFKWLSACRVTAMHVCMGRDFGSLALVNVTRLACLVKNGMVDDIDEAMVAALISLRKCEKYEKVRLMCTAYARLFIAMSAYNICYEDYNNAKDCLHKALRYVRNGDNGGEADWLRLEIFYNHQLMDWKRYGVSGDNAGAILAEKAQKLVLSGKYDKRDCSTLWANIILLSTEPNIFESTNNSDEQTNIN